MIISFTVCATDSKTGNTYKFGPFVSCESAEACVIKLAGRETIRCAWIEVNDSPST